MAISGKPDKSDVKSEALAWVARLKSGEATRMDAHRLSAWRAQSEAHEEAFREAAALWRSMAAPAVHETKPSLGRRAFLGGAMAAGVAGIAWGGAELELWPGLSELMVDQRTAAGEQRSLTLADGSLLDLNTRTGVSFDFNQERREVALAYGEAAFTIKARADVPFIVKSGNGRISADVPGLFSVRSDRGRAVVTCVEGPIRISCGEEVRLEAGEQVEYANTLGRVRKIDPALATSWRKGMLVFENRLLAEVVSELNRYRRGRIILTDRQPRRVNGVFHLARPDEALEHIVTTFGLTATRLPGGWIVLG